MDGYFSKKKFIDGVANLKLHQIGKLRCDANMRYLYTGPKREKGSGNQKTYDGKVDWQDLSRFTYHHTQDGIALYSLVLNHQCFKRNVKVVVLVNEKIKETKKKNYALLFSTDKNLDAKTIVTYYKARFQIEFYIFEMPNSLQACLTLRQEIRNALISISMRLWQPSI